MSDKKTVDYTDYPPGSLDLSDPKNISRILTGMRGGDLAIVAHVVLLLLVKDLPSVPNIAYMSMLAITLLGALSYRTGHRIRGKTSIEKKENTDEP